MDIRIEIYEDQCRLFVDGVQRETVDREFDYEDFFPLMRELGATVTAVQYEADAPDDGTPNLAPGHVFS